MRINRLYENSGDSGETSVVMDGTMMGHPLLLMSQWVGRFELRTCIS